MLNRATLLLTLALLCSLVPVSSLAQLPADKRTLIVGWYPWDPYTYTEESFGAYRHLTGLDVELLRAALQPAGYDLQFVQALWEEQMTALAQGTQEVAMGALEGDVPEGRAQFSRPYRTERIALYTKVGDRTGHNAETPAELLAALRENGFRLGVSAGYSYGPEVDAFISDPANARRIVTTASEYELFRLLEAGRIDGLVADQLVAATVGWRVGLLSLVRQHPVPLASNEVRMAFASQIDPQIIAAFDQGIEQLQDSGDYWRIFRHYVLPLLLAETVERPWFAAINIVASFSLSVSGVILAYAGRFSVFGAFVLASLPAVGGGVMRDLIAGRSPIGLLQTPQLLLYSATTVALGWLVIRYWPHTHAAAAGQAAHPIRAWFGWVVTVCDAIGLGALTVVGVMVAMLTRSEPLLIWGPALAVVTNVGGGVMRDLVYGSGLHTLRGSLYAEIAIVWGTLLSLFFYWQVSRLELNEILLAVLLCCAGASLTRISVVALRISSPMLVPPDTEEAPLPATQRLKLK